MACLAERRVGRRGGAVWLRIADPAPPRNRRRRMKERVQIRRRALMRRRHSQWRGHHPFGHWYSIPHLRFARGRSEVVALPYGRQMPMDKQLRVDWTAFRSVVTMPEDGC